jgi:hypothetical protein
LDYNIEDDGGKRDGLRKKIFLNNREKINKHNSHTKSYLRKLNQFAAMVRALFNFTTPFMVD